MLSASEELNHGRVDSCEIVLDLEAPDSFESLDLLTRDCRVQLTLRLDNRYGEGSRRRGKKRARKTRRSGEEEGAKKTTRSGEEGDEEDDDDAAKKRRRGSSPSRKQEEERRKRTIFELLEGGVALSLFAPKVFALVRSAVALLCEPGDMLVELLLGSAVLVEESRLLLQHLLLAGNQLVHLLHLFFNATDLLLLVRNGT